MRRSFRLSALSPAAVIDGVVRPGDVVLTGSGEGLSFLIRSGLGSEVSHAAIAVAPGWGVEARDGRADAGERTPAVYLRTTAELVSTPQLARVVVRRPKSAIDTAQLQRVAQARLRGEETFASISLGLLGMLRGLDLADDVPQPEFIRRRLRVRSQQLTRAAADGVRHFVCAELVYRALLAAGLRIDLSTALFAEAMALLPEVPAHSVPNEVPIVPFADLAVRRDPGDPIAHFRAAPRAFITEFPGLVQRQVRARFTEAMDGDRADLVTPADLHRAPELETVAEWVMRRGRWTREG